MLTSYVLKGFGPDMEIGQFQIKGRLLEHLAISRISNIPITSKYLVTDENGKPLAFFYIPTNSLKIPYKFMITFNFTILNILQTITIL